MEKIVACIYFVCHCHSKGTILELVEASDNYQITKRSDHEGIPEPVSSNYIDWRQWMWLADCTKFWLNYDVGW